MAAGYPRTRFVTATLILAAWAALSAGEPVFDNRTLERRDFLETSGRRSLLAGASVSLASDAVEERETLSPHQALLQAVERGDVTSIEAVLSFNTLTEETVTAAYQVGLSATRADPRNIDWVRPFLRQGLFGIKPIIDLVEEGRSSFIEIGSRYNIVFANRMRFAHE